MKDNTSLRTSIRLGALELALNDFLSLKPGSKLKFCLPEKMSVELEVGGSLVGRGELRVAAEGFELGIIEVVGGCRN